MDLKRRNGLFGSRESHGIRLQTSCTQDACMKVVGTSGLVLGEQLCFRCDLAGSWRSLLFLENNDNRSLLTESGYCFILWKDVESQCDNRESQVRPGQSLGFSFVATNEEEAEMYEFSGLHLIGYYRKDELFGMARILKIRGRSSSTKSVFLVMVTLSMLGTFGGEAPTLIQFVLHSRKFPGDLIAMTIVFVWSLGAEGRESAGNAELAWDVRIKEDDRDRTDQVILAS